MDYINKEVLNKLKDLIGQDRFKHSLGVMETAEAFCIRLGEDPEKGKLAGLFHDCGKFADRKKAMDFIEDHKLTYNKEYLENFQLLHPHFGADVAKLVFKIDDPYILDAIAYHTTLRAEPSLLDKIIYITDAIEPNRDFQGVEELRKLANEDLDRAILYSLEETIVALLKKKKYLGLETIEARNYFLKVVENRSWFFDLSPIFYYNINEILSLLEGGKFER